MMIKKYLPVGVIAILLVFIVSCEKIDSFQPTPTNELMEGVWKVSAIYDEKDSNVTEKVNSIFPAYIHMDDINSVNSTMGPLFMYIVYGDSRFTSVAGKLDEVFKYVDIELTEGEWFIDKNKVVDNFTLEIKMKFPVVGGVVDEIFSLMNVPLPEFVADVVDFVVYHKFRYVTVQIDDENPNLMIWEFTDNTVPTYNTKDKYGDLVTYTGVPVNSFKRCRVELTREIDKIETIVKTEADKRRP